MNLGLAKLFDRHLGALLGRLVGGADLARELTASPRPVESVRHLLVVKFWGLGNWALLRPVVLDLRARWPLATLTVATLEANRVLVEDLADHLLLVRPRGFLPVLTDLVRAVSWLRRQPPDLAVDFEQFAHSGALLARLGRSAQRVGFLTGRPGRDGLYNALVPFRPDVHASRSFRDLAEAAGVPAGPYTAGGLEVSDEARAEASPFTRGGPYVLLHPGSGDNFPGRRWSVAGFAAVARAAGRLGQRVVVSGGPGERELAARVVRSAGSCAVSTAGRVSVAGLLALIADAQVLVANDTGPVHVASALGVPVLGFYGPNTPVIYGPLAPGSRAFFRGLPCSPCLRTSNYRSSRCRIHTCMAAIPTGEVTGALERLLRSEARRSPRPLPSRGGAS